MMTATDVEQMRARARSIRRTAALLDDCDATRLASRAGDDVWIGPTPQRCHDDLVAMRATIRSAHDELIAAAARLDAQADVATLVSTGGGGAGITTS